MVYFLLFRYFSLLTSFALTIHGRAVLTLSQSLPLSCRRVPRSLHPHFLTVTLSLSCRRAQRQLAKSLWLLHTWLQNFNKTLISFTNSSNLICFTNPINTKAPILWILIFWFKICVWLYICVHKCAQDRNGKWFWL